MQRRPCSSGGAGAGGRLRRCESRRVTLCGSTVSAKNLCVSIVNVRNSQPNIKKYKDFSFLPFHQYLVCPSLFWIAAQRRLGVDSTICQYRYSLGLAMMPCDEAGSQFHNYTTFFSNACHVFLIGYTSDECPDHSRTRVFFFDAIFEQFLPNDMVQSHA